MLGNLLANAARHAPPSPIQVAAALDGGHVELSVADEGRGVAPEELPYLFRKYAGRAPGAGSSGRGLGLAICKGIVEAHGGRIRAESADPAPAPWSPSPCRSPTTPVAGARARVLVVDDDPRTLRFAREALDGAGFDTMATGNFRDLARILDAERPALVLLDLVLPGSDGIELMAQAPGARRAAGHLHLRLRPHRGPRAGARRRRRRLPGQAVLGDRTDGAGARRAAAAGRPGGSITMSSSGSRKAVKAVGRRKRTMTEEQCRAVAERMRRYWVARRAEKAEGN